MQSNEKFTLQDFLMTQKQTTDTYNNWSNECTHENLRSEYLNILKEEHDICQDIFREMQTRGYYPVKEGQMQEVDALKQKFS